MDIKNLFPNIDFTDTIKCINSSKNIVITTHINPDGDAIGSSLSLYYALTNMKKKVNIIISDSGCPEIYKFLTDAEKIQQYKPITHNEKIHSADTIIVVDCGELARINILEKIIREAPAKKILIDHHINSERFADYSCVDENAIATGEIIFALLKQANIKINKQIADALYCSIYSDSGGFRFYKTSQRTHFIAGLLLKAGTNIDEIYDNVYNKNSLSKIQIRGLAMASMKAELDGKLIFMFVTKKMFLQTKATNEDTEELTQIALSVKNVKVAILIREYDDGLRVSLRSKQNINIEPIAKKFNGGGHLNAAGCKLNNISTEDAKKLLTKEVEKILK
ncbi:MAG: bifunctional oligoribonuclease/PAP phosphatase NrnA [Bacteroidetes bacterium]|nr:bifunctional oligoribonuclease/PAP phosphatase NrnA [Bacteroidota bacterium]